MCAHMCACAILGTLHMLNSTIGLQLLAKGKFLKYVNLTSGGSTLGGRGGLSGFKDSLFYVMSFRPARARK